MLADMLNLLVQGGFGNFAFFDVHHQAIVCPNKPNIQSLLKLVPLAANHQAIAVAKRLGTGKHRIDHGAVKTADALE